MLILLSDKAIDFTFLEQISFLNVISLPKLYYNALTSANDLTDINQTDGYSSNTNY